jgi:hypothetical protein
MWGIFWVSLFFAALAAFCIHSALITWKGVDDLWQLFALLKRSHDQAAR